MGLEEVKCHFYHIMLKVHVINMTLLLKLTLITWLSYNNTFNSYNY